MLAQIAGVGVHTDVGIESSLCIRDQRGNFAASMLQLHQQALNRFQLCVTYV